MVAAGRRLAGGRQAGMGGWVGRGRIGLAIRPGGLAGWTHAQAVDEGFHTGDFTGYPLHHLVKSGWRGSAVLAAVLGEPVHDGGRPA